MLVDRFVLFFQTMGLSFVMSSITTGVAATVPTDKRITKLAAAAAAETATTTTEA